MQLVSHNTTIQRLSSVLAGCLSALTLALALPISMPRWSLLGCAAAVGFGGLLPGLVVSVSARARLARLGGAPGPWNVRGQLAGSAFACVLGLSLLVPTYLAQHPRARIVNLTGAPLRISVDGAQLAELEPTSLENARAGVELRLPAGMRRLEAHTRSGEPVASAQVVLRPGAEHLFAPGSAGTCFWLEHTRYGRAAQPTPTRVPLRSSDRFWAFEEAIDNWFSPNPEPSPKDDRSSGGVLTALRQAPCGAASAGSAAGAPSERRTR